LVDRGYMGGDEGGGGSWRIGMYSLMGSIKWLQG